MTTLEKWGIATRIGLSITMFCIVGILWGFHNFNKGYMAGAKQMYFQCKNTSTEIGRDEWRTTEYSLYPTRTPHSSTETH